MFFSDYRNKYKIMTISSFLTKKEKFSLIFLTKFMLMSLQNYIMLSDEYFQNIKNEIKKLKSFNVSILSLIKFADLKSFLKKYAKSEEEYNLIVIIFLKFWNKIKVEKNNSNKDYNTTELRLQNIKESKSIFVVSWVRINNSLKVLNLTNSNLKAESLKILLSKYNKSWEHLYLNNNDVCSEKAISYMIQLFPILKSLVLLSLSTTQMEKDTSLIFARNIHLLPQLQSLYLNENPIKESGDEVILSLSNLPSLKHLELNN
jgi:hypothetical protein